MTATREFTISREFAAPRELVFRAWTDPRHLTRWYGPRGCTTPLDSISADVRPGGMWRATLVVDATGEEHPTGGFYLEIRAPERLVFTWREPGGDAESVITIELADLGDGRTAMTFHQAGFTREDTRRGVHAGWSSAFERLAEYITEPEKEL